MVKKNGNVNKGTKTNATEGKEKTKGKNGGKTPKTPKK